MLPMESKNHFVQHINGELFGLLLFGIFGCIEIVLYSIMKFLLQILCLI